MRSRSTGARAAALLLALSCVAAAGCGGADGAGARSSKLRVFAASSLTEAFGDIADEYEDRHDDIDVELVFGGSAALAAQVEQGAEADVLAAADRPSFERAAEATGRGDGEVFARNRMALIVPSGNPAEVEGVADLDRDGVSYVACAQEVPCGAAASQVLDQAGVTRPPVSREDRVKAVVAKVSLGEVDAGLVYATDIEPAKGTVEAIDIPDSLNVRTDYLVGAIGERYGEPDVSAFVDLVLGDAGRRILEDHGFELP